MNQFERESPSFDPWAEVLEAHDREETQRRKFVAAVIEWVAVMLALATIVAFAIWRSGR